MLTCKTAYTKTAKKHRTYKLITEPKLKHGGFVRLNILLCVFIILNGFVQKSVRAFGAMFLFTTGYFYFVIISILNSISLSTNFFSNQLLSRPMFQAKRSKANFVVAFL